VKDFSKQNIEKINKLLGAKKKIVIIGHNNPDGDSVGGSLGLYNVLIKTGNDVSVIMPSKPNDFLQWLPNQEDIVVFKEQEKLASRLLEDAEIIFCVDFNSSHRVDIAQKNLEEAKAIKFLIDHHPEPETDAEFIFSDTIVSSASELVYEFIKETDLNKFLNKDAATCIFTGIMTDTLNFSVNSSRQETFAIVGELLTYKIDKDFIYDKVYNNYSINRLKLVGYLLYKKMQVVEKHGIALIIFTEEEMARFNFAEGDHEGIVNMPLSVAEIKASIIAVEKDDFVKLSLRSKGEVDVNKLARKYFNGGGHKNAAGGKVFTKISDIEDYIKKSLDEYNF